MYPAKPADELPPAFGVPVGGPGAVVPVAGPGAVNQLWSSGLFDCLDDSGLCCLTCWCPCITFGRIAEIVDRGALSCGTSGALYALLCSLTGCQWVYSCTYRQKMRAQFGLADAPCGDCCVHCCCETCALCQEYKELTARGFAPDLGWHLNQAAAYPPAPQRMGR